MKEQAEPAESSRRRRRDKEVRCAKCGEINPGTENSCKTCGARLYVACHECGHSNPRSASACAHCGHRLHRRWLKRVQVALFGQRPKITAWQIILLVVAVYVGYKAVIFLVEYRAPVPAGTVQTDLSARA